MNHFPNIQILTMYLEDNLRAGSYNMYRVRWKINDKQILTIRSFWNLKQPVYAIALWVQIRHVSYTFM